MTVTTFKCIDAHTCGNPVRVVTSGAPELRGETMSERRQDFIRHHDWIRQALMFEPRGHDMMSGSFIYPPINPDSDAAILFIETSGCLPMCGHGTIGTVTIAIERGLITPKTPGKLRLDAPAGLIEVAYTTDNDKVTSVTLSNVASYLAADGLQVNHSVLGKLDIAVGYGGNFYGIVDVQRNFPGIHKVLASELLQWSTELRQRLGDMINPTHPLDATVSGVSHLLWGGEPKLKSSTAANAVFYGVKALDRSPCGTGTSARMAHWHATGKLAAGQEFVHESIIGSQFVGRVLKETQVGEFPAIIPSISGWARIIGDNNIIVDESDPFARGFSVV